MPILTSYALKKHVYWTQGRYKVVGINIQRLLCHLRGYCEAPYTPSGVLTIAELKLGLLLSPIMAGVLCMHHANRSYRYAQHLSHVLQFICSILTLYHDVLYPEYLCSRLCHPKGSLYYAWTPSSGRHKLKVYHPARRWLWRIMLCCRPRGTIYP